jgi:hypothetical protein
MTAELPETVTREQYRSILCDMESDLRDALGESNVLISVLAGFHSTEVREDDLVDALQRLAFRLSDNLQNIKKSWDRAYTKVPS